MVRAHLFQFRALLGVLLVIICAGYLGCGIATPPGGGGHHGDRADACTDVVCPVDEACSPATGNCEPIERDARDAWDAWARGEGYEDFMDFVDSMLLEIENDPPSLPSVTQTCTTCIYGVCTTVPGPCN